jgi:hypothetical protein
MRLARPIVLALVILVGLGFSLRALQSPGADMATAANAFLSGLSPELRAQATFAIDEDERLNFHFIPRERKGVSLKQLDEAGKARAHALLKTGLGQRGYLAATTIIDLENVLRAMEMRDIRDPELYFVSIFGTPGGDAPWGWRFEGHHLSLNFTIAEGRPVAWAPSFFGANPAEVRVGEIMKGARPLADVEDLARTLVTALDADQQKVAIFTTEAPRDIVTGAEHTVRPLEAVGIAMRDLRPNQREMLQRVIDAYLDRMAPPLASARRQALASSEMDDVRFGWAGVVDPGGPHYYRIQGATFLIEYDNVQNNNNHIHSIWRDFDGDFGRDLLREHYAEYAH